MGIALSVAGTTACTNARAGGAGSSPVAIDPCLIAPLSGAPLDTVQVVLRDDRYPWVVRPNVSDALADDGANHAPAFILAQVYETLVRVTCAGDVRASLAEQWAHDNAVPHSTFTLRSDARFADGQPVTAADVAGAWTRTRSGGSIVAGEFPFLFSLVASNDRTLIVATEVAGPTLPHVYGALALGIGRSATNTSWPVGTGGYAVDAAFPGDKRTILRPVAAQTLPILDVTVDSATDPRDLLDRGVDLLVSRDPVALDYARRNDAFAVHALPWDRTYVLAIPSRIDPASPPTAAPPSTDGQNAFRSALARDAVRGEARAAAEEPEWWHGTTTCSLPTQGPPRVSSATLPRRITYSRNDPVGRGLAERLVALAHDGGSQSGVLNALAPELRRDGAAPLTAVPTDTGAVAMSDGVAHVIAIPHHTIDPCMALRTLHFRARWLEPSVMVPLIDTRPSLIARRGVPLLSVDWEGTLRVHPTIRPNADPP